MKPTYSGFEAKKTNGFAELPPPGAYVAEIQGVRTELSYDKTRDVIVLMLEITEGEYKDRYHKVFEDQKNSFGDGVKYKGVFRLTPYMEGDEEWRKNQFEGNIWCIQESNKDYHWDWDENKLKGKKVGINVRKVYYKGNDGELKESTEICQLETVEDVKGGKCRIKKERRPKEDSNSGYSNVTNTVSVPF